MDSPEDLLSSVDSLIIRKGDANEILDYLATEDAATAKFLRAFLDCLPPNGVDKFCQDILNCKTPAKLRQLQDTLFTGLLVPRKSTKQNIAVTQAHRQPRNCSEEQRENAEPFRLTSIRSRTGRRITCCLVANIPVGETRDGSKERLS